MKKLTFARSPVMSSYLLAFIVGEFDFVEGTDANGVVVRVYTPVGKAEQGRFALDVRRGGRRGREGGREGEEGWCGGGEPL